MMLVTDSKSPHCFLSVEHLALEDGIQPQCCW
uniref:Uncharacterized protein n=1 Tax=Anguilla anguilla TaxID=7936 RepID=A0A0E9VNE4_ANGAN